jgi:hypothetical protein
MSPKKVSLLRRHSVSVRRSPGRRLADPFLPVAEAVPRIIPSFGHACFDLAR